MSTHKNELTKSNQSISLQVGGIPEDVAALLKGVDAQSGLEGVRTEDLKLPFFGILQKASRVCDPDRAEYNPNAKPGMFMDTAVSQVPFSDFTIVPLKAIFSYTEFKDQKAGGGFVGTHDAESDIVKTATDLTYGKKVLPNGNQLLAGYKLLILSLDKEGNPALGWFTASAMGQKDIKDFLSNLAMKAAAQHEPMYLRKYAVTTKSITNNYNTTTHVPVFTEQGVNSAEVIKFAQDAQARMDATTVKASLNTYADENEPVQQKSNGAVDISAHMA